jgi:protein O-mannosyl-transferase
MKKSHLAYVLAAVVALMTLAVYTSALHNDFVNWDDDGYVVEQLQIRALNPEFFTWAFTDLSHGFWHPLTWISYAVDHALWGLKPAGYHLTNILLHALNTFLVVCLVIRLVTIAQGAKRGPGPPSSTDEQNALITAGMAGVLFGLHPLHVESVAWVSERKDLLCALFFLASILVYVKYASAREGRAGRAPSRPFFLSGQYLLSLLLFLFALSSKTMAVSLPAVLVLLDWYPLGRVSSLRGLRSSVIEKVPFIAGSLIISIVSIAAQSNIGALSLSDTVPLLTRVLVAFKSLMLYLGKMVLPVGLLPLYPYPKQVSALAPEYALSIILAGAITVLCLSIAGRQRLWLALWGYYVVTLLPVLGIVQIGYFPMADRFTYLPSLGPFVLAGLSTAWVWTKADSVKQGGKSVKLIIAATGFVLVTAWSIATVRQISIWNNSISLWSHVIEKEPGRVPAAYSNRGAMFGELKQLDRAIEDFNAALAIDPAAVVYNNRGKLFSEMGRLDEAIRDYDSAIAMDPAYYLAYNNRGILHHDRGQLDRAIEDYTAAIALKPDYANAYTNRGIVYGERGQLDQALSDFTAAISVNPYYADAYVSRGLVFAKEGQHERAREDLDRAIALNPASSDAYLNRGVVFEQLGQPDRAITDYGKAIALRPDDYLAYTNRGSALGKTGRQNEAIDDLTRAIALRPDLARTYLDRGDLYRGMGRRERAARDYRKACDLGERAGCNALRAGGM